MSRKENRRQQAKSTIVFSIAFDYSVIRETASEVQKRPHWQAESTVQSLEFSNMWISNFLTRANMTRRKITREEKAIPSPAEVVQRMREGQQLYIRNLHTPWTTWNMDETSYTWAIGPTHLFCPISQQRASNMGIADVKLRVTAVVFVSGTGDFGPLMIIIKHSVSSKTRPDQTNMKVIPTLFGKKTHTRSQRVKRLVRIVSQIF